MRIIQVNPRTCESKTLNTVKARITPNNPKMAPEAPTLTTLLLKYILDKLANKPQAKKEDIILYGPSLCSNIKPLNPSPIKFINKCKAPPCIKTEVSNLQYSPFKTSCFLFPPIANNSSPFGVIILIPINIITTKAIMFIQTNMAVPLFSPIGLRALNMSFKSSSSEGLPDFNLSNSSSFVLGTKTIIKKMNEPMAKDPKAHSNELPLLSKKSLLWGINMVKSSLSRLGYRN